MKRRGIINRVCWGVAAVVAIILLEFWLRPPDNEALILTLDSTREKVHFISEDPVQLGDGVKLLFVAYDPEVEQVQLCLRTNQGFAVGKELWVSVDGEMQTSTWRHYQELWRNYMMAFVSVPQGKQFTFTYQGTEYTYG